MCHLLTHVEEWYGLHQSTSRDLLYMPFSIALSRGGGGGGWGLGGEGVHKDTWRDGNISWSACLVLKLHEMYP